MPDEKLEAKLIVPDTGPLITLAAADCLDYLLYPGVPVYIPDAVLYDATVRSDALGAQSITDWAQRHGDSIRPLITQVFTNYLANLDRGIVRRERDMGERAALEAIRYALVLESDQRAVFITEDDRLMRSGYLIAIEDRNRMIPITTRDFLEGLEAAQRINSADEVYQRAEDAGRLAARRTVLAAEHANAREAVETMLRLRPNEFDT